MPHTKLKSTPWKGPIKAVSAYVEVLKPETFTVDDLVQWGQQNGFFYSRRQYTTGLSTMIKRSDCPVSKTDETGVFRHKPMDS